MVDLAYPMKIAWDKSQVIRRFRCRAKVEAPLKRIFQKTLAHYGAADVSRLALDIFGGCYNYCPGVERLEAGNARCVGRLAVGGPGQCGEVGRKRMQRAVQRLNSGIGK
ncbi:hypothetical protein [Rhizobium gallicum]|uniref:hypothetical protein n=1 Tax=Rhizobium gallicum TaxID=56730 RepID=UPI001EF7F73C|nr:hypothetical protein [Rhizobium gallicum]ULJ72964.1 hypothetical protein L2W42_04745 [Rhizobium gallicum]